VSHDCQLQSERSLEYGFLSDQCFDPYRSPGFVARRSIPTNADLGESRYSTASSRGNDASWYLCVLPFTMGSPWHRYARCCQTSDRGTFELMELYVASCWLHGYTVVIAIFILVLHQRCVDRSLRLLSLTKQLEYSVYVNVYSEYSGNIYIWRK